MNGPRGGTTGVAPGFEVQSGNLSTYARLYPGMDGMAANGLR
jgi:hypothetical protein